MRPMNDYFYEFKLPQEHMEECQRRRAAKDVDKQSRAWKVSTQELESFRTKAVARLREYLGQENHKSYQEALVALQVVCGRRAIEVLQTMEIEQDVTNPMLALVRGLTKDKEYDPDEVQLWKRIPLLCEYELFELAFDKMRRELPESVRTAPSHFATGILSRRILKATTRVFGQPLYHAQKRNIYIDLTYNDRHSNRFMEGDPTKYIWGKKALCHKIENVDITQRYQTMLVED